MTEREEKEAADSVYDSPDYRYGVPGDLRSDSGHLKLDGKWRASLAQVLRETYSPAGSNVDGRLIGKSIDAAVVFVDMTSFTATSHILEPHKLAYYVNRMFHDVGAAAQRYDGTIDKTIGDAAMVIFAEELGSSTPAESALCTLRDLFRFNHHGYGIHAGMAFGPVWLGVMGVGSAPELTVIGSTVNMAARLDSRVPSGVNGIALPTELWETCRDKVDMNGPWHDDEDPEDAPHRWDVERGQEPVRDFTSTPWTLLVSRTVWIPSYSMGLPEFKPLEMSEEEREQLDNDIHAEQEGDNYD